MDALDGKEWKGKEGKGKGWVFSLDRVDMESLTPWPWLSCTMT
jgi:hypothetical protein